ncbi:hypothetical protein EJB05_19184, partial [Eragrostis curvula]
MDAQGAGRGIVQMPQIPDVFFSPPPPPSILSYSSSYSSPSPHHPSSITSFPILVLTVVGILITSVLLLTYYVFVIKCCLKWQGSSDASSFIGRRGRHSSGAAASSSRLHLPVTGTPAEARGLEESTIQALPTFRYRKAIKNAADSAPTSECAVCLSEFEEEERVRMLPSCLHAFHVDCIDTWLQGNANCPLCRAAITGHCMLPLDQLQRPEEVDIQVPARTEEQDIDTQPQQHEVTIAVAESAGDAATVQQVSSGKRNNAWRDVDISSNGDEWSAVKKDRDVLPLRRSSSMGSLGEEVRLQIQNILQRNAPFHRDDTGSGSSNSRV